MAGFSLPHFETGTYQRNSTFLEDAEYSRALDTFVKACVDVLLINELSREVLIMKRIVHPQPDWWFVGGRMRAGDTPREAASKNVRREMGISVPPERFEPLSQVSYLWQYRQQEPQGNGTADVVLIFTAEPTAEERTVLKWDTAEYSGMRWAGFDEVAGSEAFHPALRRAVASINARSCHRHLTTLASLSSKRAAAAADNGDSSHGDVSIAAAARAYARALEVVAALDSAGLDGKGYPGVRGYAVHPAAES